MDKLAQKIKYGFQIEILTHRGTNNAGSQLQRKPMQFKHVTLDFDGPLREPRNNRQLLGPDRWEKGKYYVDEQTWKLPDWVSGPDVTVMVGVWKGDARLRVISGPNDGDNSALVGKLETGRP